MTLRRGPCWRPFVSRADVRVQESTVTAAICNDTEAAGIMGIFGRHRTPLFCTEDVVTAAAKSDQGPDALEVILQQDRDAKISSSMVIFAMRAYRGAALISVMLNHDHTLTIVEDLIAAASNCYDPYTISAFLQMKGKLGDANPTSEVLNTDPAKRRSVSSKPSPRINTNVTNVAFSHPEKGAALQLLKLSVEWGSITATDCDNRKMAESDTRTDNDNRTPEVHAHSNIPPTSQLSPGIDRD